MCCNHLRDWIYFEGYFFASRAMRPRGFYERVLERHIHLLTMNTAMPSSARYAIGILENVNVDPKMAFCHWRTKCGLPSDLARKYAKDRTVFGVVLDCAGFHEVQSFDVLYVKLTKKAK